MLEKKPFQNYTLDEEKVEGRKILSLSLTPDEKGLLKKDMVALQQVKEGTTIKQLWLIGRSVLHGTPEGMTVKTILDNLRKNQRIGIIDPSQEIMQK